MSVKSPIIKEPHPQPLPASEEGRESTALQQISVEELASYILRETIAEKVAKIRSSSEHQAKLAVNPLREMQPYAYLAQPNEPVISPDDCETLT